MLYFVYKLILQVNVLFLSNTPPSNVEYYLNQFYAAANITNIRITQRELEYTEKIHVRFSSST